MKHQCQLNNRNWSTSKIPRLRYYSQIEPVLPCLKKPDCTTGLTSFKFAMSSSKVLYQDLEAKKAIFGSLHNFFKILLHQIVRLHVVLQYISSPLFTSMCSSGYVVSSSWNDIKVQLQRNRKSSASLHSGGGLYGILYVKFECLSKVSDSLKSYFKT